MTDTITLSGEVSHIGYRSSDGWACFNIGGDNLFSEGQACTGTLTPMVSVGTVVTMTGNYTKHPKYGTQFKADSVIPEAPETDTDEGVIRLLMRLPGIGEIKATQFVDHHGAQAAWRIARMNPCAVGVRAENEDEATEILRALSDDFEAITFFLGKGLSSFEVTKIVKQYGADAIAEMTENPYRIIRDIEGLGFKKADVIALKLGMDPGSPARTMACVIYILEDSSQNGGNTWIDGIRLCAMTQNYLEESAVKQRVRITELPDFEEVKRKVYQLRDEEKVIVQDGVVSPASLYHAEMLISREATR